MSRFLSLCLTFVVATGFVTSAQAAGVNRVWYDQQADGTVLQTIQIQAPAQVYQLTFRYCDGLTCGNPQDPELDCYLNKYNPQFPAPPRVLTITPPPGSTAQKIFLKAGSLPGFTANYGYYDAQNQNDWNSRILANPPNLKTDGNVVLNFRQPNFMGAFERAPSGRVCGLTDEQYQTFQKTYGNSNDDNFYQSALKVAIVWSPPNQTGLVNSNINLDGSKRDDQWVYLPTTPPKTVTLQRADPNATFLNNLFVNTGAIPTLVSSLLTQLGGTFSPESLAQALKKAGVASQTGFSWSGLQNFINSQQPPTFTAHDITAAEALRGASQGQTYLTTMTVQGKDDAGQSNVFLTDYDPQIDQVKLLTTDGKTIQIPTETYLKGQPWIMEIKANQ